MYNYKILTDELANTGTIPKHHIYDYSADPIFEIYERYFQYCQKSLSEYSMDFEIQPGRIFYYDDSTVNAAAAMGNSYFLIRINKGLIANLYRVFYVDNSSFDDSVMQDTYKRLISSVDVPLGYVMFQLATYFTYYHERAHLIQKSPILNNFLDEQNLNPTQGNYSSLYHSLEFDADLDAAHCLLFVVFEYLKKLPMEYRDSDYVTDIISLAMASVFTYFMFLEEKYSEIYYKEGTHPHPIVRITYILDVMVGVAKQNMQEIELNDNKILLQCFKIATVYCEVGERANMVANYSEMLHREYDNIRNFIDNVLIPESNAVPCLVKNRR